MSKNINDLLINSSPMVGGEAAHDDFIEKSYPLLHQMLTVTVLANGKKRTPSTLFIFGSEGSWKVCLSDKGTGKCLWATSDTVGGLTAALEALLDLPVIPWRTKS